MDVPDRKFMSWLDRRMFQLQRYTGIATWHYAHVCVMMFFVMLVAGGIVSTHNWYLKVSYLLALIPGYIASTKRPGERLQQLADDHHQAIHNTLMFTWAGFLMRIFPPMLLGFNGVTYVLGGGSLLTVMSTVMLGFGTILAHCNYYPNDGPTLRDRLRARRQAKVKMVPVHIRP